MKSFVLMALVLVLGHFSWSQSTPAVVPGTNEVPGSNVPTSSGGPTDSFNQPVDPDNGPPSAATIDLPASNASPIHVHRTAAEQKASDQDTALEIEIRQRMDERDANFAKTVTVEAHHGNVTLSGTVVKAKDKIRIGDIARAQVGSGKVKNDIVVIP